MRISAIACSAGLAGSLSDGVGAGASATAGADALVRDVVTRGAMIDFFTLPDPQIAQLTKPALCSFSNAEADWNQLSKLWSWSHFKEYWIIPDFDLFGSPSDNRMKKGFQDTQKRPILLLQGSNETRHATKSIAVLGISEGEMAELPVNTFKAAIYAGEVQLGIWSNIRDPLVVEALGDSGFDFVTIDSVVAVV